MVGNKQLENKIGLNKLEGDIVENKGLSRFDPKSQHTALKHAAIVEMHPIMVLVHRELEILSKQSSAMVQDLYLQDEITQLCILKAVMPSRGQVADQQEFSGVYWQAQKNCKVRLVPHPF